MPSFWGKKRKNAFVQECVFVNKIFNKFVVCVWIARRTTLKKLKKLTSLKKRNFYDFLKKSQFPKSDYRFWKSHKAASWYQSMRLFGRWPLGHTLQSKFWSSVHFATRNFHPHQVNKPMYWWLPRTPLLYSKTGVYPGIHQFAIS